MPKYSKVLLILQKLNKLESKLTVNKQSTLLFILKIFSHSTVKLCSV